MKKEQILIVYQVLYIRHSKIIRRKRNSRSYLLYVIPCTSFMYICILYIVYTATQDLDRMTETIVRSRRRRSVARRALRKRRNHIMTKYKYIQTPRWRVPYERMEISMTFVHTHTIYFNNILLDRIHFLLCRREQKVRRRRTRVTVSLII